MNKEASKIEETKKKLKSHVENLKDRLKKTNEASKSAKKIRREINEIKAGK